LLFSLKASLVPALSDMDDDALDDNVEDDGDENEDSDHDTVEMDMDEEEEAAERFPSLSRTLSKQSSLLRKGSSLNTGMGCLDLF